MSVVSNLMAGSASVSRSSGDDPESAGARLYAHAEALFPLCRSITGNGLRSTLRYISQQIPLTIHEVPSGTQVLDWTIPNEWNVRSASIRTLSGQKIVDFADNNLHLLQYSRPVRTVVPREELDRHLYSLPEQPDLIPYRTAYYTDSWGFCLADRDRRRLNENEYLVEIDARLEPGSLSYAECVLPGELADEVLFSAHCCHPSLANDNLSGISVAIELARYLQSVPRRFTYRFLFAPGTIGAITWLHFNRDTATRIRHGLVLSCLGDRAAPSYKRSRQGNAPIDRYVSHILQTEGHGERIYTFVPYGYDERQFCSPGFNLPVGCLMRSPAGTFPEYHTSADDLALVRPEALADSLRLLRRIVMFIEQDEVWRNTCPFGEPQLGRRGLYDKIGGQAKNGVNPNTVDQLTLLWVLNMSDGRHSLLDIAERSEKSFEAVASAAAMLHNAGLLARSADDPPL